METRLRDAKFDATAAVVPGDLYSPLPEGSMRLLRLMPQTNHDAPIRCNLVDCVLPDSDEHASLYDAVSYTWGPPEKTRSIYLDTHSLAVTAQVYMALSHLRSRLFERVIWIDAICINQEDDEEKGLQVELMAKIYARASRVLVWLGEAAADSDDALKEILRAANQQHTNSAIHKISQQADPAPSDQPTADSSTSESNQQAIFTLLERPWFQRIWVCCRL